MKKLFSKIKSAKSQPGDKHDIEGAEQPESAQQQDQTYISEAKIPVDENLSDETLTEPNESSSDELAVAAQDKKGQTCEEAGSIASI
ncbi:hypothetical protein AB9M62_46750 [Bacillales bacterium AN1005]